MPPLCFASQPYGFAHVTLLVMMSVRAIVAGEVDLDARQERVLPDLMAAGLADNIPAGPS